MLMIRLQRVGRKNYAEFRIVVTEKTRAAKSSNYVELVGHYNPHSDTVSVEADRVKHWISKGAQVSGTVHNLLISQKVLEGKKVNVLPKKTPIVKPEEAKKEEAPVAAAVAEVPASEEAPVEEVKA
jgi:small subunit ribosomal protein S16